MQPVLVARGPDVMSLADAKLALGVEGGDEDTFLQTAIPAAVEKIERFIGRSLSVATWDLFLDAFPTGDLRLPKPPLKSIVSLTVRRGGLDVTVLPSAYRRLVGDPFGCIVPAGGVGWPASDGERQGICIRFTAGWDDDDRPPSIKMALVFQLAHMRSLAGRDVFLRREEVAGVGSTDYSTSPAAGAVLTDEVRALIRGYKVWFS